MSTLLKWLFTLLAFWWLYHALRPWLMTKKPPAPPKSRTKKPDRLGEYIDYEEVDEE